MVETPVLFITFARPEYARQTWEGIKAAQPKTLYFYSNKGREEKDGEVKRNNEIRKYINEIDWKCDLHTWFRKECVNAYDSIRGAIDWLFENEECGIVLEEDCVPTKAFFSFVDQMIPKFRNEAKVWCISGDNYLDKSLSGYDYFFSHYHWMYGWASWRRVWSGIRWDDNSIKEAITNVRYRKIYKTFKQVLYKRIELHQVKDLMIQNKCWDYVFGLYCDCNEGLTICPREHLITNVGVFGIHHDKGIISAVNKLANPQNDYYLINNYPDVKPDLEFDKQTFYVADYSPLHIRTYRTIIRQIKRLCKI